MTEPAKSHRKLYSITQKPVPDEIDDFKPKKKTVQMIKSTQNTVGIIPAHGASQESILRVHTKRQADMIQSESQTRYLGSGTIQETKARLGYEETIVSNEATLKPNHQEMYAGTLHASRGKKIFSNNSSQMTNLMKAKTAPNTMEGTTKKKSLQ